LYSAIRVFDLPRNICFLNGVISTMKTYYLPLLYKSVLLAAILFFMLGCKGENSLISEMDGQCFNDYWYQGKAEISSYELSQSRYGAIHNGTAVMVFVSEDISKTTHIKLDDPLLHKSDAVNVLKLNTNKEFVTGIYKYSMMSSVYTPVDQEKYPHSFKLTAGIQEWCGQTFMQANWKGNRYEVQQMSYFESEGDSRYSLVRGWLEDELWTSIRIAPNKLPIGEVKMIASPLYLRLTHQENKVYDAVTSLTIHADLYAYSVYYPELNRTLDIEFETGFPHKILGWRESYGDNEVTTGRLLNTIMSDYWMRNHPEDEILRDQLDLPY